MIKNCIEATELASLSQEKPLSAGEKMHLYSHFMICSSCRNYHKNSKTISKIIKEHRNFEASQVQGIEENL